MGTAQAYTLSINWPTAQQRVIRDTLTFRAASLPNLAKSAAGGIPVWKRFASHLRTRHRKTFDRMVSPITGVGWTPLLDEYAETKPPGTKNKILFYHGTLRKALTTPKGKGHIERMKPQSFEFGVGGLGVYPLAHNSPVKRLRRKDGASLHRQFLGMKLPDDMTKLGQIIRTEMIALRRKAGGK